MKGRYNNSRAGLYLFFLLRKRLKRRSGRSNNLKGPRPHILMVNGALPDVRGSADGEASSEPIFPCHSMEGRRRLFRRPSARGG